MIPKTAELLKKLYPGSCTREFMPAATILYMGPGGNRQWPMSINALIDRFSLLIHKTRTSASAHLAAALQEPREWCPRYYRKNKKIAEAPASPIKFLDIGTKMGLYEIKELIPYMKDKTSTLRPRSTAAKRDRVSGPSKMA